MKPLTFSMLARPDGEGGEYHLAADSVAYTSWQHAELAAAERPARWSDITWQVFKGELNPDESEAVKLRLSGHSGREIAKMVGCSEGMIRKRLYTAAVKLWFALWVALDPYERFAAAAEVRTPPRGIGSPIPRPCGVRWPDARPLPIEFQRSDGGEGAPYRRSSYSLTRAHK